MTVVTLLIIEMIICFITLILLYKNYKTNGIYAYTVVALILTMITSLKTISLYNYDINLGIIPLISIFTGFNIVLQKNGPEALKTLLLTVVSSSLIGYIIIFISSFLDSSNINLFTNASFNNIFNDSIRVYFAILVTTLYSLLLNSKLYYYLKVMKNNILISNLFSTIIIQFIASVLFGIVAYVFVKDTIDIVKIIMIRYLVSLCIGVFSTIPIYISKYIKE